MNPHQAHSTSLVELFASFWRNRQLIAQMTWREVVGRYRGSVMGLVWSFFNPLLMLSVYTFVFSVVFKTRWGGTAGESKADFAILLFVGILIHGIFSECVNKAPTLILSNVNYVKRVIFPLEILPWVGLGSALFHAAVTLFVLLTAQLVLNHQIFWTAFYFPLIVLPLLFITMGFGWSLAATGVFVRDIGQMTGIFTTVLMFMAPVFYPMSMLPTKLQPWITLNPLTLIIEQSRQVLIVGQPPDWGRLVPYSLGSLVIAWAGFWWFQKTRKGFADVL